jgi:hypothetical protein
LEGIRDWYSVFRTEKVPIVLPLGTKKEGSGHLELEIQNNEDEETIFINEDEE